MMAVVLGMLRTRLPVLAILFCAAATAQAIELNTEQETRYQALIEELRCLVCQNQNIAESNAPLAKDLRRQVAEMISQGRSDREIKIYLADRYGDFVLYRPPFKPTTWLLWLGPFILLALGLLVAVKLYRGRRTEPEPAVDHQAVEALLRQEQGQEQEKERDS